MKRIHKAAVVISMAVAMGILLPACAGSDEIKIKEEKMNELKESTAGYYEINRASVLDPSICKDVDTGEYYVFGSHLATAKSEDLVNWTQISSDYENTSNSPVYGKITENLKESFKWAGENDGDCTGGFAVYAPDVIWDDYYIWNDGSRGAYLLYYSTSSTWRRSCIGVAVSKDIEGPYEYIDTMVYSGITADGTPDGISKRDTKWNNDYLNFNKLLDLGSENGGIDDINDKWFKNNGSEYNTDYAPNAIDPNIVTDEEGNWYMVYGSWSGGIFILDVDKETGLVKYPGTDSTDEESETYTDRYYGTHIAGGNHQSGEGAFIIFDEETGFYYLYETYGSSSRTGGYNMRMFRSENIKGPYVDAAGGKAGDNGNSNYKYGIELMSNYRIGSGIGYCSAGHNSALIDGDGNRYLIYHQRFDNGTEYHEVRVHQQFMNEDGWPVTAVYENRNEKISGYDISEVTGTYDFINHKTENYTHIRNSVDITLMEDGTVKGEIGGTWEMKDSGEGYDYITITSKEGTVYKGFFFRQTGDDGVKKMTFSAIGDNNECIWGSHKN